MKRSFEALFLLFSLFASYAAGSPCYDHQTDTYKSQLKPTDCGSQCKVTPFFSPDHSVDAYVSVIKDATFSIDLMEPDFKSWSTCTKYTATCGGKCIGCTLEDQYNEPFPVFPALLNAVHASSGNLTARFLTNNFDIRTCQNMTTPLDWWAVNGIKIRHYKTTTFQHAKFIIVDKGRKILISSVNFSKTSFTGNREAGVIIENCNCPLAQFYQDVFDSDWDEGEDYQLDNDYSKNDINYMTDTRMMPMGDTGPYPVPGSFITEMTSIDDVTVVKGYTGPDYARDTFMEGLDSAKKSLVVHIYQITDDGICDKLLDMHNNGINVTLLVGSFIVSYNDYKKSQECYGKLYSGGMQGKIQKTYSKFKFSHQKYWIVDDTTVHLSTGNWSPTDFPTGSSFRPYKSSYKSVNRDMLVVMEGPAVVQAFSDVFTNDWNVGKPWEPKTKTS